MIIRSHVAAVSWPNQYGGARDKRAALVMIIMGRLEITSGWSNKAKHIPDVPNVLADGISRWQPDQIAGKLRSHVNEGNWRQVHIDQSGHEFLSILLQPAFLKGRVDEVMWSLLTPLTSCFLVHARITDIIGTEKGGGRHDAKVANLVEKLAWASVGDNTQKRYGQTWRIWCNARAAQGKSP